MSEQDVTSDALSHFHPAIRKWFAERVGTPTDIQARAWPRIVQGEHVLVTAPTGSGKTLTAFLSALNAFATGAYTTGGVRVLYISPLKALNTDIERNLSRPLTEIREYVTSEGHAFPEIRTGVRSGDTDQSERRRMLKHPPEIFITTPESLIILLTSRTGVQLLDGVKTVILDEIHAVADSKRGTYLMAGVERLAAIAGEFQRVTLSATINPLTRIADFVGGYVAKKTSTNIWEYTKRKVAIVRSDVKKEYRIRVAFPEGAGRSKDKEIWWAALAKAFAAIIAENRSTLLFANSRRMVEKVTRFINNEEESDLVYSHHGSLAKEIRRVVEERLKKGELKAIVATSSLELGIDIGDVDEVVLIQSPFSVASAIQRVGRAGHGVGEVSKGTLSPIHGRDFIEAAVIAKDIPQGDIEPVTVIENPLDVLAQVILSMVALAERNVDDVYGEVCACNAFHTLSRREFDLVVEMLAGRYADTRVRELSPRLMVDRVRGTIAGKKSATSLIYLSGGVIADRGYYNLRQADTKAKVGELDEEFVWERSLGEAFPFGNRIWRIKRITHNDVEVLPATKVTSTIPFWKGDAMDTAPYYAKKVATFLERANERLHTEAFRDELIRDHFMSPRAADELIAYLGRQVEASGSDLPHRHHLLIEHFRDPVNARDTKQTVLHTLWGGQVNRPFAFALAQAWEEKFGYTLETYVDNNSILLILPHEFSAEDIIDLLPVEEIPRLLRARLENTGYFGAHFRENAQRALLLPRRNFKQRTPLWLNRLRSKKLLEAVMDYEDFPVILETWRTCVSYGFNIDELAARLDEIRLGDIAITEVATRTPTPFAEGVIWTQTNYYMYEDDKPGAARASNLSDELLHEVMFGGHARPALSDELIRTFSEKVARTYEGYAPTDGGELLDWLKERMYVPYNEWKTLLAAVTRDGEGAADAHVAEIADRIHIIERKGEPFAVVALEMLPRVSRALAVESVRAKEVARAYNIVLDNDEEDPLSAFLALWLRYYGPVEEAYLHRVLPLPAERVTHALATLAENRDIVIDVFREQHEDKIERDEICERENLEILLRMRRAAARPNIEPRPLTHLPLFVAQVQGVTAKGEGVEDLEHALETLFGYPMKAALWETDAFPSRLTPYYTSWLDSAMRESTLAWVGVGKGKTTFAFTEDLELFFESDRAPASDNDDAPEDDARDAGDDIASFFRETPGKASYTDIARATDLSLDTITKGLWKLAFAGRVSNNDYETLRKGILSRFRTEPVSHPATERNGRFGGRRSGRNRWRAGKPFTGNWFALPEPEETPDALDREELVKDRVRQLFLRYGVIFREVLWNELHPLRFGEVFRTLRLMELSGEVFTGQFFEGIPGLQFASHAAVRTLTSPLHEERVWWVNACDPASLCGIGLDDVRGMLPARRDSTHIVFHGARLVLVSKRKGKDLTFTCPSDEPRIVDYLRVFHDILGRQFHAPTAIRVETVNDEKVTHSAYRDALRASGFRKEMDIFTLYAHTR